MSKYKGIDFTGNSVTFADKANVRNTLNFTHSTASVGPKQSSVPILRNEIVLVKPVRVSPEGCSDACSAVDAARSVRVKWSNPLGHATEMASDIDEVITVLVNTRNNLLQGFLPDFSQEIDSSAVDLEA